MNGLVIFQRCRQAPEDIDRLERMAERKRERMRSLGGWKMDPNGGSRGWGESDRMAAMAAAVDEAEEKKRDREEAQRVETAAVDQLLDLLPELEGEILERYYLNRDTLSEVARKMHLTAGYVRAKKRDADMIAEMISAERVAAAVPDWYRRKWWDE